MAEDTYSKFSRVVQDYVRYRPRYPQQIIPLLEAECGLETSHLIADIGSGTGLLTEVFLKNGNRVYGVEPNAEMRAAAEITLQDYPAFISVDGSAEHTRLDPQSVHMITAGQAFHYFHEDIHRDEFQRILKPGGWLVLIWNLPINRGTAFGDALEKFWHTYVVAHENFRDHRMPDYVTAFFGSNPIQERVLDNPQVYDYEAFKGRILSGSNTPPPDDPRYPLMMAEIQALFNAHQQNHTLTVEYETRLIYGPLDR